MQNLKYILITFFMIFLIMPANAAQVFSVSTKQNMKTANFPAGALLKGKILNNLSSTESRTGDVVYTQLVSDIKLGKTTCIPKKTLLSGEVIRVDKAKQGRNGIVQVKYNYMKFPDGWGTPFSGRIWTQQGDGIVGGEPTKRSTYRRVPHYIEGIGSVVQLVETGNRVMGKEKFVKIGTEIIIVLDNNLELPYLEKL